MGQLLTALTARRPRRPNGSAPPSLARRRRRPRSIAPQSTPRRNRSTPAFERSARLAFAPSRLPGLRLPRRRSSPPISRASPSSAAVRARLVDERLEERRVLALLGVPEHADGESLRRILERLERAVFGPRRLDEPFADRPEPLMVVRLDRGPLAEQGAEAACRPSPRPRGRRRPPASPCASRRRRLRAGAGRDRRRGRRSAPASRDRPRARACRARARLQERELAPVPLRPRPDRLGVRSWPYSDGSMSDAAGEQDSVERVERLLDPRPRSAERAAAGHRPLRPSDVRQRDHRGRHLPDAPAHARLCVRRDPDHRSSHVRRISPARSR